MKLHRIMQVGLPVVTVITFALSLFLFLQKPGPNILVQDVKAATFLPKAQTAPESVQASAQMYQSLARARDVHAAEAVNLPATYTVRSGDSLSEIAHKLWGHASDWPALWYRNRHKVADPTTLIAGVSLTVPSSGHVTSHMKHRALEALPQVTIPLSTATGSDGSTTMNTLPQSSGGGGGVILSAAQIGALWVREGGSPSAVGVAECIAEHESGGNTHALSPTNDWGVWQINGGGPAMWNPVANAQRAIAMSDNGTNWGPWTTAPDCGV